MGQNELLDVGWCLLFHLDLSSETCSWHLGCKDCFGGAVFKVECGAQDETQHDGTEHTWSFGFVNE